MFRVVVVLVLIVWLGATASEDKEESLSLRDKVQAIRGVLDTYDQELEDGGKEKRDDSISISIGSSSSSSESMRSIWDPDNDDIDNSTRTLLWKIRRFWTNKIECFGEDTECELVDRCSDSSSSSISIDIDRRSNGI